MQFFITQHILGLLLMCFSITLLPPIIMAWWLHEPAIDAFLTAFSLTLLTGFIFWLPTRHIDGDLRLRDGFIIVVMFWLVLGLFGAIPFVLTDTPQLSVTDSIFESLSGLTTTGATVITNLENLPRSILYYRQQLQWFGGMGIIVLAVAILPILGIGGMQLYRAETPGPVKDSKITPRITETAKALWLIYCLLTLLCAASYWLAGMNLFDAVGHSFSTIAIGGFSTHNASLGYFHSPMINVIAIIFMLIAGINFSLHFMAWRSFSLKNYWRDTEFKAFFFILASISAIVSGYLYVNQIYSGPEAIMYGIFQTVSIGTTSGFSVVDYGLWPAFLPVILLFSSFIGGCAGSTGGGMKVIRFVLLFKQGLREITQLIHPNAKIVVKLGGKPVPERIITSVWGFFSLYVASFSVMMLALMMTGIDQITAFSAMAACMNNLGPGMGDVSITYSQLNDTAKWILSFAMLLGRLEIFTLLVLFSRAFWRN